MLAAAARASRIPRLAAPRIPLPAPALARAYAAPPPAAAAPAHSPARRAERDLRRSHTRPATAAESPSQRRPLAPAPTPRETSAAVRQWLDARPPTSLTTAEVDELVGMLERAPRASVNAPVWSLVLGALGKSGQRAAMWKAFNKMKKSGIAPTSRTYATLLSAYAGPAATFTPHKRPEPLTLSRVALIYDQAMAHMRARLAAAGPAAPAASEASGADLEAEVNLRPVHAYLRFLARYGMYRAALSVLVALPASGPLCPTAATYTILFEALNHIERHVRGGGTAAVDAVRIGEDARALWDRARTGSAPDPPLVLAAMQALSMGRPDDARLAEALVPAYFALDPPTPAAGAPAPPPARLPDAAPARRFAPDVRSATALLNVLTHARAPSLAAHYAHRVLADADTARAADTPLLRVCVRAFANVHDVDAVRAVLDTYQPTAPRAPWLRDVWHDALWAARWARDWEAALALFRRMAHLPLGVEDGAADAAAAAPHAPYVWAAPNGQPADVRGVRWARAEPVEPDAKAAALLVQCALAVGVNPMRQALRVVAHVFPGYDVAPTPDLATALERASERVLEVSTDDGERRAMEELGQRAAQWQAAAQAQGEGSDRAGESGRPALQQGTEGGDRDGSPRQPRIASPWRGRPPSRRDGGSRRREGGSSWREGGSSWREGASDWRDGGSGQRDGQRENGPRRREGGSSWRDGGERR